MLRCTGITAAVLFLVGTSNVFANVGGQTYVVDVSGSSSGEFKARLQFVDLPPGGADAGLVGIDIENAGDATGNYSTDGGTVITVVSATGISPDDVYLTKFTLVAIDIKQVSTNPLWRLLTRGKAGVIPFGIGFSTTGELLTLSGSELLN